MLRVGSIVPGAMILLGHGHSAVVEHTRGYVYR